MSAILSSAVDLLSHQLRAVRRVLEDHVQRYLLADEVGMGKTIEAGIILHQYLLDDPDGEALVIVPPTLVGQWRGELAEKFGIMEDDGRVAIVSTEDFQSYDNPGDLIIGLLILDEAHHAASWAFSQDEELRSRYEELATMARHTEKLLLLSATPILNHEPDFLAMLHLLEPDIYPLDGMEAFRDRVRKREGLATCLLNFKEDGPVFPLRSAAESLRRMLPADPVVASGLDSLQPLLLPGADVEERRRIVRHLRNHISDTYRLHRRLIRNRRSLESEGAPLFRKPPRVESDLDSTADRAHDLLEQWRDAASGVAMEEGGRRAAELKDIFLLLFRACGTWLPLLGDVAEARIGAGVGPQLAAEFSAGELASLTSADLIEGEADILRSMAAAARVEMEEGDRVALVLGGLRLASRRGVKKSVVFSEYTAVCHEIYRRAMAMFGQGAVACHTRNNPDTSPEEEVNRFRDEEGCTILVCDKSGQEGRNFQYADLLFHVDLPLSPNMLEQRIGRLDRIGRDTPFASIAVAGPPDTEDSLHEAWYRVLTEGFGVFSGSIASLQYYVERKLPELAELLFLQGAQGIIEAIPTIKSEIADERQSVQHQDLLDQIDVIRQDSEDFIPPLKEFEKASDTIQRDTEAWVLQGLRFTRVWQRGTEGVLKYRPTRDTLLPHEFMTANFTTDGFEWSSYRRSTALKYPGTRLVRIGNPFIDLLGRDLEWDDRGRAFAMWRTVPEWSQEAGEELTAFRFDYVVEADLTPVAQLLGGDEEDPVLRALRRRSDGYLPPELQTIFVGIDGSEIVDKQQLSILRHPYAQPRDRNLGGRRADLLDEVLPASNWGEVCERLRDTSTDLLRSRSDVLGKCEAAALRAQRDLDALRVRLESLSQFESANAAAEDAAMELELYAAMALGIRSPRVVLDAVGCIVVSGRRPGL